jgi:predicted transcriptional regulator
METRQSYGQYRVQFPRKRFWRAGVSSVRLEKPVMTALENIDLDNLDENITVEEYLKQECNVQIERLRKHADDLVRQFQAESADVRERLVRRLAPTPLSQCEFE